MGDIVSSYEIAFSYQGPCSGFTHTNTTTVEGTSRNYALTALQEFSNYTVSVTAVNDVGNATATVFGTTLSAGNQFCYRRIIGNSWLYVGASQEIQDDILS